MSRTIKTSYESWEKWAQKHFRAEGQVQGALQECRKILRRLLENRFGSLPPALVQRINTCDDLNQLEAALDRVPDIRSLNKFQI